MLSVNGDVIIIDTTGRQTRLVFAMVIYFCFILKM